MNWKGHTIALLMAFFIIFAVYFDVLSKEKKAKRQSRRHYNKTEIYKMQEELRDTYNSYARELNREGIKQYTPVSACRKYNKNNLEICNIIFERN